MGDQSIINIENENEAEKSEMESDEIESDAEFDSWMFTPESEWWNRARLDTDLQKLYRAAMDGQWEIAKGIIEKDQNAKTKNISSLGFTALHVAASCGRTGFVVELVKLLTEEELEITDQLGRTALHHVALAASVKAARAIVEKNPHLPQLGDVKLQTPLLYAAQRRSPLESKEMLEYLCQVTKDELPCLAFKGDSASSLIVAITASGSYDIALRILNQYPRLAYSKNDKRMSILHVLAMEPSAFMSASLWKLFTCQWKRKVYERKLSHLDAARLVEFVCGELQKGSIKAIQEFFIPKDDTAILHLAIEHGVFELVRLCLTYFPDLIWYANNKKRLLLHAAIEHRRVCIFNYLTNFIGTNTMAYAELTEVDEDHNNSLHLAAKLSPSPQLQSIPGPAFQMQREVQWFKAVEALVDYESRTAKNKEKQTPRELFVKEHADLLQNAKDWMKYISNSCMVVAALVATIAFAAMITVPGGSDSGTGIPILSKEKLFIAFTISNALSLVSSTISLSMSLGIQSTRYREEDFLDSIPQNLRDGLIFLLIAVVTMMISFAAAIGLTLQKRIFDWAYIPIMVVACCPVVILYEAQFHLIFKTPIFTSGPGLFKRQRDSKFRSLNKIGYRLLAK